MNTEDRAQRVLNMALEADAADFFPATPKRHRSEEALKAAVRAHQLRIDAARASGEILDGEELNSYRLGADVYPEYTDSPAGIRKGDIETLRIDLLQPVNNA